MSNPNTPFHPIIYVRGYAITPDEIDATTADPFNGFNIGSTVYRATTEKAQPRKFIFESPIVRLASDFGYEDVFQDGKDILDPGWDKDVNGNLTGNKLKSRSIIIHRYYDEASRLLGTGEIPPINEFAKKLSELILRVKTLVCANTANGIAPEDFRCYLVAHSMGGLVCRAFLQDPDNDPMETSQFVDKFFTYATPHNGIDLAGINVPRWLEKFSINTFSRENMREYLGLNKLPSPSNKSQSERADWLPDDRFSPDKVFCMVGTNRQDYDAGMGISRTFAGNGSDGLVRIENATLRGLKSDGTPGQACAKAFAYRAHSGVYGIVNSEEAYQNLTRFLFGNVRVDIFLDIIDIRLPSDVQKLKDKGNSIDALYQFEVVASPRGKPWFLTRRTATEDSVACLKHTEWEADPKTNGVIYLSSVFLANRCKVNPTKDTLSYQMKLNIRVPDYEVERKLWFNEHYEGRNLFQDTLIIELAPPAQSGDAWIITGAWQGSAVSLQARDIRAKVLKDGKIEVIQKLPTRKDSTPGLDGQLRLVVSTWNPDALMEN